jgi:hypothetical protein
MPILRIVLPVTALLVAGAASAQTLPLKVPTVPSGAAAAAAVAAGAGSSSSMEARCRAVMGDKAPMPMKTGNKTVMMAAQAGQELSKPEMAKLHKECAKVLSKAGKK